MTNQQQEEEAPEDDGDGDEQMEARSDGSGDGQKSSTSSKSPSKSDDNVETSSTGSSEGKSGSGGYTADCSASDQSSDDTGGKREGSTDVEPSVQRLSLGDATNVEDGGGEGNGAGSSAEDDEDENDETTSHEVQPKETATTHRPVEEEKHGINRNGDKSTRCLATHDNASTSSRRSSIAEAHLDALGDESESELAKLKEKVDQVAFDMKHLPQWNGVRIQHPMDPRIDLSSVRWRNDIPVGSLGAHGPPGDSVADQLCVAASNVAGEGAATLDSYQRLMEVVRPYFLAHGIPYMEAKTREESEETQGSGSSEGFTSFFTTTHSSGSTNGGNSNSSDMEKKPKAKPAAPAALPPAPAPQETHNGEASDTSSMIVLARSKRKHQKQGEAEASGSSLERRVRIHQPEPAAPNPRAPPQERLPVNDAAEEPQESSMSSASSSEPANVHQEQQRHFGVPPRFVTDVSSSNRTDSTGSNMNSASGSGSAGNTGSGTGSGSNIGSSGSGNDGKGSSEDVAQGDNSGEGTNEGSDEAESKLGLGLLPGAGTQEKAEAVRERKLQDKKRKRIVKRREYEAQQQSESSENKVNAGDSLLRPGKPVTMDQVLQFSKIPRLVVLANPPFLVVHTNAAYCRLTGIDSHKVVGKPIRTLLSVPEEGLPATQGLQDESIVAENTSELSAAAAAGRARASRQNSKTVELERMIASSGFGHLHTLHVHAKQHHLVGKNVSFISDGIARGGALASTGVRDEGSNDTSLTGSFEGHPVIRCQSSIAPVVSSVPCLESMVVSDKECSNHQKTKRRKLHGPSESDTQRKSHTHGQKESISSHRKHSLPQRTTHFVIQLQPHGLASAKQGSEESLSSNSTSVEARLLGMSKADLLAQRQVVQSSKATSHESDALLADDDAAASESTETREPVSTVG